MDLRYVENELDALGLALIPLNVLHPDHASYDVLLNQYKGTLKTTPTFVGNSDETHTLAEAKFVEFLKIAQSRDYDLVVCPEYSCPWESLKHQCDSDLLPHKAKLWILGMESITPTMLKDFIKKQDKTIWIYDKELCDKAHAKIFFDPICILFKAKSKSSDNESNVCVLQFKTSHMSVHNDKYREVDHLIEGKYVYVLKNPNSSICLLSLVCSDSLVFDLKELLNKGLDKLLLVHIQMNLEPRHEAFKKYRDEIFGNKELDKIEVLCLNWAKHSKVLQHEIQYSGTAYFYKPDKPVLEDSRLDENQKYGLFYSYWRNNKCHIAFFNSDELLIGFRTDKTSQVLSASALQRRKGPVGIENYEWVDHTYSALTAPPDKFKLHCDGLNCDLTPLQNLSPTNQERLIRLSTGLNLRKDSFEVTSFDFYLTDHKEYVNRMTFTEETDIAITQSKSDYLMRLKELIIIFKNKALFPSELAPLVENSKIFLNYAAKSGVIDHLCPEQIDHL